MPSCAYEQARKHVLCVCKNRLILKLIATVLISCLYSSNKHTHSGECFFFLHDVMNINTRILCECI